MIAAKYLEVAELISSEDGAAAELLERVDAEAGKRLRQLVGRKPGSHYGEGLLSDADRKTALRCAAALVQEARTRTL